VDGDSLEAALRDYGPAAIDDLLPRLRVIAEALDQAHDAGQVHGSLHPQNIFISADDTRVGGLGPDRGDLEGAARPPYAAPEVASGGRPVPASDQFALAAIAYEWLFGRRVSGAAERPVDVRTLPGVDRAAMSAAFTRALAPQAAHRFASCTAFCDALAASVIPMLPLGDDADADALDTEFLPETVPPSLAANPLDDDTPLHELSIDAPMIDEPAIDERVVADPHFDAFEPTPQPRTEPQVAPRLAPSEDRAAWQPGADVSRPKEPQRFTGAMLIVSCLVGMVVGFAAGYMARPRALQTGPVQTMTVAGEAGRAGEAGQAGQAATPGTDATITSGPLTPSASARPESGELRRDVAAAASGREGGPVNVGRLLVRSTPSGASVEVDGVARGVTPLALRDLELGSRTITVTRRGYIAEEHRVALTAARPSRSLELRLASASAAGGRSGETSPKPAGARAGAGGAAAAPPSRAVATGTLVVESRPAGAVVVIDGKPRGTTPLTIPALPPGDYRVSLSLAGFRPFATTVRVVAGERTRAAASLSVQE